MELSGLVAALLLVWPVAASPGVDVPPEWLEFLPRQQLNPGEDSRASSLLSAVKAQGGTCPPVQQYCSSIDSCCDIGEQCCDYGYCMPAGRTCCPNKSCGSDSGCCGPSHCYPLKGGQCCDSDGHFCDNNNHCYLAWDQKLCCSDEHCTAYRGTFGSLTALPASITRGHSPHVTSVGQNVASVGSTRQQTSVEGATYYTFVLTSVFYSVLEVAGTPTTFSTHRLTKVSFTAANSAEASRAWSSANSKFHATAVTHVSYHSGLPASASGPNTYIPTTSQTSSDSQGGTPSGGPNGQGQSNSPGAAPSALTRTGASGLAFCFAGFTALALVSGTLMIWL